MLTWILFATILSSTLDPFQVFKKRKKCGFIYPCYVIMAKWFEGIPRIILIIGNLTLDRAPCPPQTGFKAEIA